MSNTTSNLIALERTKKIAEDALTGKKDILLACRELSPLKVVIAELPEDVIDTLTAIASETDSLPIGSERQYWSKDALKDKDAQAENYRNKIKGEVLEALQILLTLINNKITRNEQK